jgi:hypothetical protein
MDERIDAALKSYAEPPEIPASGVALARMLERAGAMEVPRRRWLVWVIPATGFGLAVLVTATMLVMRAPRVPEIAWTPLAPGVASPATAPTNEAGSSKSLDEARHAWRGVLRPVAAAPRTQTAALPKLETFPAPMPVSPEEQKLRDFARRGPSAAKQQVMEARQHADDPLEIAELAIQPLDEGDNAAQPKGKGQP